MNKYFILNILFPIFIGFAFTSCGKEDDEPVAPPPSSSSLRAPTGVSGAVVSDGVKLSWKPVDGAEFYIVTRSNSIDVTPVALIYIGRVGEVYDTSVIDINPLDGDNYYYIQASTKVNNAYSFGPRSAPIYVHYTRDANPPVGDEWIDPVFAQVLQERGYITDAQTVTPYDVADISRLSLQGSYTPSLKSLRGLQYFISLLVLNCNFNELTDLDVSKNPQLLQLYCKKNQLTHLDVSKNPHLTHLLCNENQLTDIDISTNTQLEELNCSLNKLTHLDLSNNSKLLHLTCDGNQLTDIDFPKNSSLWSLECRYNQLSKLDLSKNTQLSSLNCNHNQLTSLDISNNPKLSSLDCKYNQLTSLDISNNTKLLSLDCRYNQLTSLDISTNTSLRGLDCNSNQLTGLDISKNTNLQFFECDDNPGRNNVFIVTAWFDSTTIPSNFPTGSWDYDGQTVTIEYHKAE